MSQEHRQHDPNEQRGSGTGFGSQPAAFGGGAQNLQFGANFLAQQIPALRGDRSDAHDVHAPLGAPSGRHPHDQLQHTYAADPRLLAQSGIDARLEQQRALHAGNMPLAEGSHAPHSFPGAAAGIAGHMGGFNSADVPSTPALAPGGLAGSLGLRPQAYAPQQPQQSHIPAQLLMPQWIGQQQALAGQAEQPHLSAAHSSQFIPGQPQSGMRGPGGSGGGGGGRQRRSQGAGMWQQQPASSLHAAPYGGRPPPLVTDLRTCDLSC